MTAGEQQQQFGFGPTTFPTDGNEQITVERVLGAEATFTVTSDLELRERIVTFLPVPDNWPDGWRYDTDAVQDLVGRPVTSVTLGGVPIAGPGLVVTDATPVDDGTRLRLTADRYEPKKPTFDLAAFLQNLQPPAPPQPQMLLMHPDDLAAVSKAGPATYDTPLNLFGMSVGVNPNLTPGEVYIVPRSRPTWEPIHTWEDSNDCRWAPPWTRRLLGIWPGAWNSHTHVRVPTPAERAARRARLRRMHTAYHRRWRTR